MTQTRYGIKEHWHVKDLLILTDSEIPKSDGQVIAKRGTDGVWRPTRGHTVREMKAAFAILGV